MSRTRSHPLAIALATLAGAGLAGACDARRELGEARVRPSLEDLNANGDFFTPSTLSFLRGRHSLEQVRSLTIEADEGDIGRLKLTWPDKTHRLDLVNVPLRRVVPRLYYRPASPPDVMDRFNLMMAEFSRNGHSVPVGAPGDALAHFETDLTDEHPWTLAGDYDFVPNPGYRPVRVFLVNNCLASGLWELSAADRGGEIYHAWFEFPRDAYLDLVARANGLDRDVVSSALTWRTEPARIDLDRLRSVKRGLGRAPVAVTGQNLAPGYSTQDSRQKLGQQFVTVFADDGRRPPRSLGELTSYPVELVSFIEPGKYSSTQRVRVDLGYLSRPASAEVRVVDPKTQYPPVGDAFDHEGELHLEIEIALEDGRRLIFGNLAGPLLVPQQDYVIHGFGVGILPAAQPAERAAFLFESGPAASFAYLVRGADGAFDALNTHEEGLEAVFIRTRPHLDRPIFEITISSYERIVDLVKLEVEIPRELVEPLRTYAAHFVLPLYQSYQDDNIR